MRDDQLPAKRRVSLVITYSDRYDLNLGNHVFPSVKYRLTRDKLIEEGVAKLSNFVEPQAASDKDVALIHHRDYIQRLKTGSLSPYEILRMEIPYSPELIRAVWVAAEDQFWRAGTRSGRACR